MTVNSSDAHGSLTNPYVISTVDDWEKFVKFCGTTESNSSGKYFVLANDIDFSSGFHPVAAFCGTFYGCGYSLKNITVTSWQYWNGSAYATTNLQTKSGFGVFCYIKNANITDLVVEDYNMQNMPNVTTTELSAVKRGTAAGAVVGAVYGTASYILNCHTKGQMSSNITYTVKGAITAGILGSIAKSSGTTTIYRCSSNIYAETSANTGTEIEAQVVSGMIGMVNEGSVAHVYDCAATVGGKLQVAGSTHYFFPSLVNGWSNGTVLAENIVGKLLVENVNDRYNHSALFGAETSTTGAKTTVKNAYGEGVITVNNVDKYSLYPLITNGTVAANLSLTNAHAVKYSGLTYKQYSSNKVATNYTNYTSTSDLITAAQTFFGGAAYKNIWNTANIANMADFTPTNNPVRNYDVKGVVLTSYSKTYDGQKVDFEKFFIDASGNSRISVSTTDNLTDAGVHTLQVTLKDSSVEFLNSSATTQTVTVTISKKPIEVLMSLDSSTGLPKAEIRDPSQIYSRDTGAKEPKLTLKYKGRETTPDPQDETVAPTKAGKYSATASFQDDCNYKVDTTKTYTINFEVDKQKLAKPSINGTTSRPYDGTEQRFDLFNYSDNEDGKIRLLKNQVDVSIKHDTTGWWLEARNAGTYTVTVSLVDANETEWNSGGADSFDLSITIEKKTLFVDFTTSNGAFVLQKNSAVTFGVGPSNAIDGDDVLVSLKYYAVDNSTNAVSVLSGSFSAAALDQGNYRMEAYLDNDLASDNCNYVLDTTANTQDFTVSSQGINIPTVEWQYRLNNGTATAVSGSGESATNPYAVTYTGGTYVFSITVNAATLANSGVKIDAAYGTNGYQNSSQINATDNAVAVTVRFIPYSAEYAFIDENGQQAAQQYKDYTLYVKVDKATIDFDKIEWSADELEYNGMNQSVSVVGGLPSFITPTCLGTTYSAIGDYVASISMLTVTDQEAAKNYVVPTNTSSIPKHNWKIVKKKVIVSWINSETSTGDGHNIIFVPTFADNSTGAVVYTYYPALENDPSTPDLTKPLTINDITDSYDATKTTVYHVRATIRDGSGGTGGVNIFDSSNCTLILDGEEVEEAFQSFEIGDNKNPIRVSLKTPFA